MYRGALCSAAFGGEGFFDEGMDMATRQRDKPFVIFWKTRILVADNIAGSVTNAVELARENSMEIVTDALKRFEKGQGLLLNCGYPPAN